jgi:diadenosine tetraphosphate (Ap4A) HIT family hydrolase
MMTGAPACAACELLAGRREPLGGVLWRRGGFALHALTDPTPLPGWLVLTSERHARAWYDLDPAELSSLGTVASRVMAAQRAALKAEHVYAFAIGDVLHHFHLHLVPRYAGTLERLRGRRCFDGLPEDMIPAREAERAARIVSYELARHGD